MSTSVDSSPEVKAQMLSTSPTGSSGGGFRDFVRRISHSGGTRPNVAENNAALEELVAMGFPRSVASRQLHLSGNDPKRAAEYLVHAAHPKESGGDPFSHPDCPVCVRELNNVRIAEGRRPSIAGVLNRVRSRQDTDEVAEPADRRRGSVGVMLRRPSIAAAIQRMKSRDYS